MKKINETKSISELLNTFTFGDNLSKGKSFSDTIKQSTLFSFWSDIAGAKLSQYTKPDKVKYQKLYVSAKSPVIIQELNLNKQQILSKLNSYSNALGIKIKDIVFDYKKYSENKNEEFPPDNLPEFFKNEALDEIEVDKAFEENIKNSIDKINFLSKEQKEKLTSEIIKTKKAEIKRLL